MRIYGSKSVIGTVVRCPKCGYRWRTKQSRQRGRTYICCSRCKRYFKK